MQKYENLDNFRERTHTLEITLQSGEFKGTFQTKVGGNTFGTSILYTFDDFENLDESAGMISKNECQITFTEDGWFKCCLTNEVGVQCEVEHEMEELKRLVVKLEIIECTIDEKKQ